MATANLPNSAINWFQQKEVNTEYYVPVIKILAILLIGVPRSQISIEANYPM